LGAKGRIEQRGSTLRVIVYAGDDLVTGRRVYERQTIKGTDAAASRRAEKKLTELRAKVIKQRNTPTSVSLSYPIDEWFNEADLEDSTRNSYAGTSTA
jgi:integrase